MDNRYKRLGKNTILVFIGNAGSKLIGLLLLPFYTRYLSPEQYGITDMVAVYANICVPIITACIADGIFIFPKDSDVNGKKKFFTSGLCFTLVTFIAAALLFYGIDIVSDCYGYHTTFTNYIWWVYIMTLTSYFQSYMQQFCRSIDKMVVFSVTGIVQTILMAGLAFWLVPQYGIEGYFWSLIAASFLSSIFSFVFSGSYKYLNVLSFDSASLKELLLYGLPLIPNSLMWWLVNGINRPIMESTLGLHSIGIYSVAHRFPSLINLLFTIFTSAWTISMVEEYKKPDFPVFYNKIIRLITVLLVFGCIVLTASSKIIVRVFAAPEFEEAWRYIPLLSVAAIFQCMSSLVGGVFMATKKSKYFFYSSIWGAVSSLVCTYLFIIWWGLIGVCIALVTSFFSMLLSRIIFARKYVKVEYKPFIPLFGILFIQVVAITLDVPIVINILVTLMSIILVIIQNKSILLSIKNQLKRK